VTRSPGPPHGDRRSAHPRGRWERRVPYWIPFSFTVLVLGGLTAAFVLVVLPNRYVFQSGMQASGVSFPADGLPFGSPERVVVQPRPEPVPLPPHEEVAEVDPDEIGVDEPPEPGPAERLWARVHPLLREGDPQATLPHFREYLAAHPDDMGVLMEYGVALARAGEWEEADAAFRRVAEATDERRARVERARLLRDRERWDEAISLYRGMLADRPGDPDLRLEFARTLALAGRWEEAVREYEELLARSPDMHGARLELARVLWSADQPRAAERAATSVPEDARERSAAEELLGLLAALHEPADPDADPPPVPADRIALAWEAVDRRDAAAVDSLHRADREAEAPGPDRLVEWANVFQYGLEDQERALEILRERMGMEPEDMALRLRFARVLAWTGREADAADVLDGLLVDAPDSAEGWALLGDLRRWDGARLDAAEAYDRALHLEPAQEQALVGREALRVATERAIWSGEDPGVGPTLIYFRDSEGFRRLELSARGSLLREGREGLGLRTGFRRVDGTRPDGFADHEVGGFVELELYRWWRQGTVRGSVTLGGERLGSGGLEPIVGAALEAGQLSGWNLEATYRHGRAYPILSTLESVDPLVRADRVAVSVNGRPARRWSLSGEGDVASLRGAEVSTWRLGLGASVHRDLTPALRVGLASRVLTFTEAAPVPLERRLYWDPEVFWTTTVPVELRTTDTTPWSAYARLSSGMGLVRERTTDSDDWVAQFEGQVGARYMGDRTSFDTNLFSTRGREGEYNALGVSLSLTFRR
jgi:tetratricopeptide (TPR) repeat protein